MNALLKLIMCWDLKVRPSQRGSNYKNHTVAIENMFLLPDLGALLSANNFSYNPILVTFTIQPCVSFFIDDHKLVHLSSFVYFRPHSEELRRIMEMKTAHYFQGIKIDHSLCQFKK